MSVSKINYLSENLYWDFELKKLFAKNQEIHLSSSQKKLLEFMVAHPNKALQSVDIFYEVYDATDREFSSRAIRNLVYGLRKLIPDITIKNTYGGFYCLHVKTEVNKNLSDLCEVLDQIKNAIALTDPNQPDNPIIYINKAFLELFKYKEKELLGCNLRLLNKEDNRQNGLLRLKEAIKKQEFIEVNIREYTKEGELIYDEITISPIFDKQRKKLIYFLSIHKDTTATHELLKKLQGDL
jgi:PAS domain S-box-containing protein